MYLAPGAVGYASSMVLPGARQHDLPPVDEYVVEPETRTEMIDGHIVYVSPASPPHAALHAGLDYVLRAHVASGYESTSDMLTRTSERWNFAADAAVYKEGTDPATGHRYLEELAFEVKHKQSWSKLTARAKQLAGRGVRRVFAICVSSKKEGGEDVLVKAGPVMEWMPGADRWTEGDWQELHEDAVIEDPCLHSPIRVRALLDAAEAKRAVVRALLAEEHPDMMEAQGAAELRGYQRGSAEVLREAVIDLCEALAIELTPARRARIAALDANMDVQGLRALRDHIKAHRRWDEE